MTSSTQESSQGSPSPKAEALSWQRVWPALLGILVSCLLYFGAELLAPTSNLLTAIAMNLGLQGSLLCILYLRRRRQESVLWAFWSIFTVWVLFTLVSLLILLFRG